MPVTSGESAGYYKYRCKNFYANPSCCNWVWVNNSPCASCVAKGLDAREDEPPTSNNKS